MNGGRVSRLAVASTPAPQYSHPAVHRHHDRAGDDRGDRGGHTANPGAPAGP